MTKAPSSLLAVLATLSLNACGSSADFESVDEMGSYIAGLPPVQQPTESAAQLTKADSPVADGKYVCTTKYYKAAPGFTDMTCVDPTTDVIYPGALIKGESIATGAYTPITAPRAPLTISTSLNGINGSVAKTIDDPKLSTVRQAINDILLQKVTGSAPANMSFTVEDVYSESQLGIALTANLKTATLNIAGQFNFNNTAVRSRIVAKFVQKYYSIDIDIPTTPAAFFTDVVSSDSLGAVSPMYVSSVSYGRLAFFTVESANSSTEIKAALQAAYEAAKNSAGGTLDVTSQNILKQSTIKAFIVGGSGSDAAGAIDGYDGFKAYITRGGDYSATSPGAPISYKLRFLNNNEIGKIVLSSEYTQRDCDLNPAAQTKTVKITLNSITSTNGCDWSDTTIDLYGQVWWEGVNYFWNTGGHSNQVSITVNSTLQHVYNGPFAGQYVNLASHLIDYDASSSDDDLGGFTPNPYSLDLNTLTSGSLDLRVTGGGCNISCAFTIEVIPG